MGLCGVAMKSRKFDQRLRGGEGCTVNNGVQVVMDFTEEKEKELSPVSLSLWSRISDNHVKYSSSFPRGSPFAKLLADVVLWWLGHNYSLDR